MTSFRSPSRQSAIHLCLDQSWLDNYRLTWSYDCNDETRRPSRDIRLDLSCFASKQHGLSNSTIVAASPPDHGQVVLGMLLAPHMQASNMTRLSQERIEA